MQRNRNLIIMGGIFIGFAFLTKFNALIFLILTLPIFFRFRSQWKDIMASLFFGILIAIPYFAWHFLKFGGPFNGVFTS